MWHKIVDKFWNAVAIVTVTSAGVLTLMGLTGTVFQLRMLF